MRIYYLDEELAGDELDFVKKAIVQKEGLQSIQTTEQVKVTNMQLIEDESISVNERTNLLSKNLVRAGLEKDAEHQVTFVMPKNSGLGAYYQMAIMEITGLLPYVVQRWYTNADGVTTRDNIRVIDGQGMIGAKD